MGTKVVFHGFATHTWQEDLLGRQNHARVVYVCSKLRECHDIRMWIDEERMDGDIHDAMCQGIDDSATFVVFATQTYVDKVVGENPNDNCKLEFKYGMATRRSTTILVMMEPNVQLKQRMQMQIGGELYIDMSGGETPSLEKINELAETIRSRIRQSPFEVSCGAGVTVPPSSDIVENADHLLALLKDTTDTNTQRDLSAKLSNMSLTDENKVSLASADAADLLVKLLGEANDSGVRENVALCLCSIADIDDGRSCLVDADAVPLLVKFLQETSNADAVKKVTSCLRNLAANDSFSASLASAGVIPILVTFLEDSNDINIRKNVALCLKALASNDETKALISSAGAFSPLVKLLQECESPDAVDDVVLCLTSLASDDNLGKLADPNTFSLLAKYLKETKQPEVQQSVSDTLLMLLENADAKAVVVSASSVFMLAEALGRVSDPAARATIVLCLEKISQDDAFIGAIVDGGGMYALVSATRSEHAPAVIAAAAFCLG
eukprot:Rmarinus@m.10631